MQFIEFIVLDSALFQTHFLDAVYPLVSRRTHRRISPPPITPNYNTTDPNSNFNPMGVKSYFINEKYGFTGLMISCSPLNTTTLQQLLNKFLGLGRLNTPVANNDTPRITLVRH